MSFGGEIAGRRRRSAGNWSAAFCWKQVPLVALLAAPIYIAAKLPIYLAFLMKRQQQWVRAQRDPVRS